MSATTMKPIVPKILNNALKESKAKRTNAEQQLIEEIRKNGKTNHGYVDSLINTVHTETVIIERFESDIKKLSPDSMKSILLNSAIDFTSQFKDWAFDERDHKNDFDYYLERNAGLHFIANIKTNREYKSLKNKTEKITDAASDIAYQNRVGTRSSQAAAQARFENLRDGLI